MKQPIFKNLSLAGALIFLLLGSAVHADEVKAAVAANFTAAIRKLTPAFEQKTGHKLLASFGATGQLYAQIKNGAPFDVFLSADDTTPQKLIAEGDGVAGSYFIYARGRLALWSNQPGYVDDQGAILKSDKYTKIAIANPKAAPYGQAAIDALTTLKLLDVISPRFVVGENIAQTQQFVSSGNVPLGFIALAQVKSLAPEDRGSWWVVPASLHKPIDQGAVLLKKSASDAAAKVFLDFLKSPEAVTIIRELGYELP
jgi:molybdate transport system substrate-binding protein